MTPSVDWTAKTLFRPNPKGGKQRAFFIPLSSECIKLLKRRRAGNVDNNGWVFPTDALGRGSAKIASAIFVSL